jgi:hypothetical protein
MDSDRGEKALKSWDLPTFQKLKGMSTREKDPETGEVVNWRGVSLSYLVDQALDGLSIEEKAKVDLVILRNSAGQQAFVPRSFIQHYPVLLAWERGSRGPLGQRGPWYSIVPWTSKPKILEENLPLERYFVPSLAEVELTNYRNLYGAFLLKRKTDPSAVRGEKLFVQNCMGCHTPNQVPQIAISDPGKSPVIASQGEHSMVKGAPRLADRQWRALINYFDAYKAEGSASGSVPSGPQK